MKQIGNYTVEDIPIGSGGMGQVLRGSSPSQMPVAIKEILPTFVQDVEYRHRIESEINFLKKLNNDNVVKVYDHFELNGNLYIVMELVEGLNIEQYVEKNGQIAWKDAVKYMIQLLRTMQDVHEHGIVHRDIKPGNIMIRPNGNICLLDFGVAKDVNSTPSNGGTMFGTVIGTDGYMSPEQAQGYSIDHRSDVYALGCVLYYMLTGQHAYGGASSFEIERDIMTKPFPRISAKVKGVPAVVQEVLDHAVDKNMMKRFQSCREFADQLARVLPGGTQINTVAGADINSLSIGRENCDICVGRDNFKVSRHHADIRMKVFTGGEFYVYTDCSSNGTMINGQMLRKGMSYNIPKGDNPEILLAGDPACRLDMRDVEHEFEQLSRRAAEIEKRNSGIRRHSSAAEFELQGERVNPHGSEANYAGYSSQRGTMSFGDSIKNCFSKYATFGGRASRAEFWYFYLFNIMVAAVLGGVAFATAGIEALWVPGIWNLAVLLPGLAVTIRRLHDVNKGWGTYLCQLIPIAGFVFSIMVLVYLCRKGDSGANSYGMPEDTKF